MCPFVAAYVGFMWMLLLLAHGQKDPNVFFLHRHIRDSFSSQTSDSMSLTDVFTWANTLLLSNLFGVYPGKNVPRMTKVIIVVHKQFCSHFGGSCDAWSKEGAPETTRLAVRTPDALCPVLKCPSARHP